MKKRCLKMKIEDIIKLMEKANVEYEGEITEDSTFADLEIDSLDIMMLAFEVEKANGKKLTFSKDESIKQALEKIND
jgi:acyl carrier protein